MSTLTRGLEVHPGATWIWREPSKIWPQFTCSFCGSVRPEDAAEWLNNGNDASGSDWKLGWPHKFYLDDNEGLQWKFYSEHLTSLDSDSFIHVTEAIAKVLHIRFEYDVVGRMLVRSPSYGYQNWVSNGKDMGNIASTVGEVKAWETELNTDMLGD